ncbi:PepSY domain-containing protein [Paracraurococcus ruber]|uniref:PepSY domain-containing protein n=1 Tax=Paracraurococcus ruber TaxID=77675 RepID=A0ABS1D6A5_9PROT|nr:PepSY domain-containing protein [Paracraurococcus ruber]MBK1662423.1 hypothetical protein [Paracraurococcus ruber]TDG11709.1 PepSY domain-containing protein [Paracraurococcus ruber]
MRQTMLAASLGLALGATAWAGIAAGQPAPAAPAEALRFSDLAARLEAQGFLIREMEREREGFEVKATDRDGREVKLRLDAATGQVLRSEDRR